MTIKIIHIGTGSRGRHWLDIVSQHPDFISVACVDKSETALREASSSLRGKNPAKCFTDLDEALDQVQADAALIASPSFLHAEHAVRVLEAGLAVMVEKPFAGSLDEGMTVVERAQAVSRPVMVAENYRFFRAERTLRRVLEQGIVGQLSSAVCIDRRDQPSHTQGPWVKSMKHPFLSEIAVHHFDSFRYLFNRQPSTILVNAYNPPGSDYDQNAAVEALIELEKEFFIQYTGTMVANRWEFSLWIEGDKGDLWTDRKRIWWRKKGSKFFLPVKQVSVPIGDELPYPKAGTVSLLNQLRDAILLGQEAETSGRDNLWTLAMVEAGRRSAEEGRKVSISEVVNLTSPKEDSIVRSANQSTGKNLPAREAMSMSVTPSNVRTLLIGWDAADAELIEQWCQQGLLPNISRMKSQGTWARMKTTADIVHVSGWPSTFTGTTPDKHGLYHAYVMCPGEQSPVRPRPDLSPFPFLWKHLNDQGKRCVIMDAFMTCPLQHFNGVQIVDWGSWSWFWEPTILPASLKQEMERKFGRYPAEDHGKVGMAPPTDYQGFQRRLLTAVEKKTEVVKWLMDREDWDLFLVVFGEAHPAGHYFWHFGDSSHGAHPSKGGGTLQHALRDVYVALDKSLGKILQQVDNRTTVFLLSGDGMGPNYSGSHILTDLLTRMALLNNGNTSKNGRSGEKPEGRNETSRSKSDFLSTIRNMIPKRIRAGVSKALLPRHVNEKLSLHWKTAGISWHQTRAFLIDNANEGYIRINLKGREPQGIVEPGKDYESLCEQIYQAAKSMINPASGELAASSVIKTDDVYRGPCRSHMPDVIIHWNENAKVTTELLTENYGLARSQEPGWAVSPFYTGNHRPNAFAVVAGVGIPKGLVLEGASILDLAPTILARYGLEPPDYMDGKVLSEFMGQRSRADHKRGKQPSEDCPGL